MSNPNTKPSTLREARDLVQHHAKAWSAYRRRPVLVLSTMYIDELTLIAVRNAFTGVGVYPSLDVVLNSPGGSPNNAYKIATLVRRHCETATGVVTGAAKSACTLIAVSMNDLILGESGELGPIDTQLHTRSSKDGPKFQSSLEIVKAIEETRKASTSLWVAAATMLKHSEGLNVDGAYRLAALFVGRASATHYNKVQLERYGESVRNMEIGKQYASCLLERYAGYDPELAKSVAERLCMGYPTHSYVIDVDEITDMGLSAMRADANEIQILRGLEVSLHMLGGFDRPQENTIHNTALLVDAVSQAASNAEVKPVSVSSSANGTPRE